MMLVDTTAFWWKDRPNFGDRLNPLLLERFSGISVKWAPIEQARIVCTGSVLDTLPPGWQGIVAGAGKLFEDSWVDLSNAEVLALRGPLTAQRSSGLKGGHVYGDPGLLADELVVIEERDCDLGLVPHWSDTKLEHRPEFLKYDPMIIRVDDDPLEVIRSIGRCKKIVTSSLHGAVVADAFGIPRRLELTDRFQVEGRDYKFRDHNATLGLEHKIGLTQLASRHRVEDLQHELFDVLETLGKLVRSEAQA